MIARGWLVQDESPSYYIYRLATTDHAQTGILGAVAAADYLEGRIRTHEQTRPEKVRDRARLARALMAHPGAVFLAYRAVEELDALVQERVSRDAQARFRASDGVEHALWRVDELEHTKRIEAAFDKIGRTYVADGHHRAAAAAEISRELRAPLFMAAHFPASQLRILGYHRLVRDLHGRQPAAYLDAVREAGFAIEPGGPAEPPARGAYGMYLAGRWHSLRLRDDAPPAGADPVDRLDVSVLTSRLLGPVLGIGDPRTDPRIDFVGGVRGPGELSRRVDSGEHAVAFTLFPVTMDEVMQVADSGRDMPPKSTWFEPKLRSGMVVQPLSLEVP
jgi:uncharacterized protein (DUF1015 family)